MTNKIGIGIEAQFDTSGVSQGVDKVVNQVDKLTQKVNQANKTSQFKPVDKDALKQLDEVNRRYQLLLNVSRELNRRVTVTGQSGKLFEETDFNSIFPDAKVRARKVAQIRSNLGLPAGGGGGEGGGGGGGGFGGVVNQVTQAGMRAMGPAGNVAANAVNAGMSSGAGAGLMGLLGGMLALGVGKIIGSAMEHITQAETNNIALDKLKRTLGDVNVSFDALKSVVNGAAQNLSLTYEDAGRLGAQFAKQGNLRGDQMPSLGGELGVGVGLARAFGLDPAQGVGVMGQMRGIGVTKDLNESKKFALLIGETIGRSGAFAKADEVMDALAGYANQQTRSSLGGANVGGYAGMFSALVGSGVPGLDPTGAGSLLARVNASLTAGGAKGEASQFFSAQVGAGMGLNPLQTQVLREGGAFATNDEAFGPGSIAARFGMKGPGGSKTFMQGSLDMLRKQYGNNPGLLAQATANHLGVSMRQSMALLSINPNQMGEMQKYNLTGMSASGIGNLSKVLYGSAGDRQGIAESLMRRGDVSGDDKAKIAEAMKGSEAKQKEVLAAMVASHEQERTMGTDIRDGKVAQQNMATAMADKVVPYLNEMRLGIMHMAGYDKGKTSADIMREVIEADSEGRSKAIRGRFAGKESDLRSRIDSASPQYDAFGMGINGGSPELPELEKELAELLREKNGLLARENERKKKELEDLNRQEAERAMRDVETTGSIVPGVTRASFGGGGGAGGGRGGSVPSSAYTPGGASSVDVNSAMKFFMDKGWTKEQAAGIVANLYAESRLNGGAVGDGGKAFGLAQWHPDRQAAFKQWSGKDIRQASPEEQMGFVHHELTAGGDFLARRAGNRLRGAGTAGQSAEIVRGDYERPKWNPENAAYRQNIAESMASKFDPITINVNVNDGKGNTTTHTVQTRVQRNWSTRPGH